MRRETSDSMATDSVAVAANGLARSAIEQSFLAQDVEVLEALAAEDPSRHSARLAWELGKLGDSYAEAGLKSEWIAHYERAVDVMRQRTEAADALASDHWDLQQHLFNVASVCRMTGDFDRGFAAIEEALERAHNLDPATAPLTLLFGKYLGGLYAMRDTLDEHEE